MITEETIKKLEELEAEATPSPWGKRYNAYYLGCDGWTGVVEDQSGVWIARCQGQGGNDLGNSQFISEFRNHAKDLLQAARGNIGLRKELAELKSFLEIHGK